MVELRKRQRHLLLPLFFAVVFGYLAYHVMHGDRGVFAYIHLKQEIVRAEEALAETDATRGAWERRVTLMRRASLDPDMLDERARAMLNVARPDEVIVPLRGR
ncbi:MAG: septum formation initiator family protein [Reyranellaceae bacterium]